MLAKYVLVFGVPCLSDLSSSPIVWGEGREGHCYLMQGRSVLIFFHSWSFWSRVHPLFIGPHCCIMSAFSSVFLGVGGKLSLLKEQFLVLAHRAHHKHRSRGRFWFQLLRFAPTQNSERVRSVSCFASGATVWRSCCKANNCQAVWWEQSVERVPPLHAPPASGSPRSAASASPTDPRNGRNGPWDARRWIQNLKTTQRKCILKYCLFFLADFAGVPAVPAVATALLQPRCPAAHALSKCLGWTGNFLEACAQTHAHRYLMRT